MLRGNGPESWSRRRLRPGRPLRAQIGAIHGGIRDSRSDREASCARRMIGTETNRVTVSVAIVGSRETEFDIQGMAGTIVGDTILVTAEDPMVVPSVQTAFDNFFANMNAVEMTFQSVSSDRKKR